MTPVRLQLARRKGFDLQKLSIETNGLPARAVTRSSRWGNPFCWNADEGKLEDIANTHSYTLDRYLKESVIPHVGRIGITNEVAVILFRQWLLGIAHADLGALREWLAPLAGKNLACFCSKMAPCHADTLLEWVTFLANRPEQTGRAA